MANDFLSLIRIKAVWRMFGGISLSTFYTWITPNSSVYDDAFLKPKKLGGTLFWRVEAFELYIRNAEVNHV